jgi:hypothetical protein
MAARLTTPLVQAIGSLRRETAVVWPSRSTARGAANQATRLFALAFVANAIDLLLSWAAVMHYGVAVEANPFPLMTWGWAHGLVGAMAVKAALLAIVVSAAAMQPRYARPLLCLVAIGGIIGAVSALAVL